MKKIIGSGMCAIFALMWYWRGNSAAGAAFNAAVFVIACLPD